MTPLRSALCVVLSAWLAHAPSAQVEHGGKPPSARVVLRSAVPTELMPPVRADLMLAEDAADSLRGGALRFAEPLAVQLGLANAGVWEELAGGARVWRLRIHSPGAKSLALVFGRYRLPQGAELYVYDDARATVRGAYTEHENRLDGEFAMRPLRGDALTLEYHEPGSARGQGELELALVAHDYRDVLGLLEGTDRSSGGGAAGRCELDVTCPLGATWGDQIDATVHIQGLASGLLCSGSLLNNTTGDGTLLILTAAHCGGLTSAVFTFNFERPGCRTGVAPCTNQITGATLLVRNDDLDVQLLRLNVPQGPLAYPVFLAGWDRTDVAPTNATVIHHPAGDSKKISQDFDPPLAFEGFWRIRDWDRGVTEGGSSGAPTFDAAGRCVGILDSGASSCQVPTDDDFSTRLAVAWPVLGPYLDPLGTGATTLDGLDLATVVPRTFAVTGAAPAQVQSLVPSIVRELRVLGSGFRDGSEIQIDGITLDDLYWRRGGHSFFNIDLPPTVVGRHTVTVLDGAQSGSAAFDVIPCSEPRLQVQNGFPGELVFSHLGVDTIHADVPGHRHVCLWSLSGVPSRMPRLSLLLGNNFTDLRGCLMPAIPASGFLRVHHTMAFGKFPPGTRVYNQTICLNHGTTPYRTSNLQETVFQF